MRAGPSARSPLYLALHGLLSLLAGCPTAAAHRPNAPHRTIVHEHEALCARAIGVVSPYRMPLAGPVEDPARAGALTPLPPEARRALRAAGLEPLLSELLRERAAYAEEHGRDSESARALTLHQELLLRLIAFDTQLSAVAFETACTRERLSNLLRELEREEGTRQLSLAVTSLVVGATVGTVAGVWDLRQPGTQWPALLGISGGAATAVLGAASLLHPGRAVALEHRHNLLRPIVEGADPAHLYPSFVFQMLTFPDPMRGLSPRERLMHAFALALDGSVRRSERGHAEHTLYGEGGVYGRALLELRADMFRALESQIQGVARDLELLNRALVRLLGTRDTPEAPR